MVHRIYIALLISFCSFSWFTSLYPESIPVDRVQYSIEKSTIKRIQKPLEVRTDRETLEYFIGHVEELTRHGKDFNRKELILEVKGNGRYGIEMPSKHVTGEFELVERQPHKVTYMGRGNADMFFNFSGVIVLDINYSTKKDEIGNYENVETSVYLKFDNAFFALLAKAASPILNRQLDKFITKFSMKTKKVVEAAYASKKGIK